MIEIRERKGTARSELCADRESTIAIPEKNDDPAARCVPCRDILCRIPSPHPGRTHAYGCRCHLCMDNPFSVEPEPVLAFGPVWICYADR